MLQRGDKQKTVIHCQYTGWPDHGKPDTYDTFLALVHDSLKYERVLVHCSAGVGRSGTFILTQRIINDIKNGSQNINMVKWLVHLRESRPGLVQVKDQYLYAEKAIEHYLKNNKRSDSNYYDNVTTSVEPASVTLHTSIVDLSSNFSKVQDE